MEYFIIFIIAIFFASLADKHFKNVKQRWIFLVLAVLPPVLMAAFRADTVGIDVTWYITPIYSDIKRLVAFESFLDSLEKEKVFYVIMFLAAKTFKTLFSVHFVNQLLIIFPIILLMAYIKEQCNVKIWKMYALYLFMQYNLSLCVIRQNVAFSIFLLGFYFLLHRKYIWYGMFTLLAAFSHNSTVIPILIFSTLYFCRDKVVTKKSQFILLFSLSLIIVFYQYILSQFSFLIDDMYLGRMQNAEKNSGGILTLIYTIVMALLPFLYRKQISKRYFFLCYVPVMGALFSILARNSIYLGRLAIPFSLFTCITIPLCIGKRMQYYIVLFMVICYWYVSYIEKASWETYPYVMDVRLNMF